MQRSPRELDHGSTRISLLTLPYDRYVPAGHLPPPLGAILVADLSRGLPVLRAAADGHQSAPWCPVCLIASPQLIDGVPITLMWSAAVDPVLLPTDDGELPPTAEVLRAVRARPTPQPAALARYVAQRIAAPAEVEAAIVSCFAQALPGSPDQPAMHRSTRWRRLTAFKSLDAHDWIALAHLLRIITDVPRQHPASAERIALDHHIDPRTLRKWLARYAGCSLDTALARAGWEWLIEAALRTGPRLA